MTSARLAWSDTPSLILGMRLDATSYDSVVSSVVKWAQAGESRTACFAPVSTVMEAHDSREFREIMNAADIVAPDGMPLVWGLRRLGHHAATRVYGPDLMPRVLEAAARLGLKVGFYGGSAPALDSLREFCESRFPELCIAYEFSPPFRPATEGEADETVAQIVQSGISILFVGLGNPKQERWMAAHKGRIPCVMLGVGAAFDFLSGSKPQAPRWMMGIGLEWFFRLLTEPRRLWRRYLKQNPRFVFLFALQLLGLRTFCEVSHKAEPDTVRF